MKIVIILAVVAVVYAIYAYNSLITLKNKADNGFHQIETQLQRRYDLIPNLVETVKGYAKHESDLLEKITAQRADMASANSVGEKAEADNAISGTLKSLFAVAENYPDLKANSNYIALQDELAGTENRIAVARKDYNEAVQSYNAMIKKFPKNIIAGMFGFEKADFFNADSSAQTVPSVEF